MQVQGNPRQLRSRMGRDVTDQLNSVAGMRITGKFWKWGSRGRQGGGQAWRCGARGGIYIYIGTEVGIYLPSLILIYLGIQISIISDVLFPPTELRGGGRSGRGLDKGR